MADAAIERYVHDDLNGTNSVDGGNAVLDFVDPDGTGSTSIALERRQLYGSAVDQILAQEDVTESISSADRVYWPLVDHLGTVRDLVENDGTLGEHYEYDSYGNVISGDTSRTRYLFTSREFDPDTGLQYNRARWYDAAVGRWVSQDPLGFEAGDTNLARYVGNYVLNATDASGLELNIDFGPEEVSGMDWHRGTLPRKDGDSYVLGSTEIYLKVTATQATTSQGISMPDVNLYIRIIIVIDEKNIEAWNKIFGASDRTKKGTYGHEQMHVEDLKEWLKKNGSKELNDLYGRQKAAGRHGMFSSQKEYDKALARISRQYRDFFRELKKSYAHGSENDDGTPMKGVEYPPMIPNDMPQKPKTDRILTPEDYRL